MRRRQRYQWKAVNPRTAQVEEGLILAYGEDSVRDYLTRRGFVSPYVSRAARRRAAGADEPPRWRVDEAELSRACAALGVTWRVEIRRTVARGRTGMHAMTAADYGRRHRITVRKTVSPEEASRTILHELTHAAQAEACGTWAMWLARVRTERLYPYHGRPMEREARANAERLAFRCARAA